MSNLEFEYQIEVPMTRIQDVRAYRDDHQFVARVIIDEIGGPYFILQCEDDFDAVQARLRFC